MCLLIGTCESGLCPNQWGMYPCLARQWVTDQLDYPRILTEWPAETTNNA